MVCNSAVVVVKFTRKQFKQLKQKPANSIQWVIDVEQGESAIDWLGVSQRFLFQVNRLC